MQFVKAKTKFVRISPRKARLAAGLIRKRPVDSAMLQLKYSPLKGSRLLAKTLKSAIANAQSRFDLDTDKLLVEEVRVDAGPILKRSKSKNKGGRVPINKRTSHFTIVLSAQ